MSGNILSNRWFFTFVTGWVVFLLLVDLRELRKNIWGGIMSCLLELWQDSNAYALGMYYFHESGIEILNVSAFFTFGLPVTMGILYLQFTPENPLLQLIHMLVFTGGFAVFEAIVKHAGVMVTPHWNLVASVFNNAAIFGGLLWLNDFLKNRAYRRR